MAVERCEDCGKMKGELHLDGCDIERCPICHGQLISCDCDFPKITVGGKYLIDEKGKKWKRFEVKGGDLDWD